MKKNAPATDATADMGARITRALIEGYSINDFLHLMPIVQSSHWGKIIRAVSRARLADRADLFDACIIEIPEKLYPHRPIEKIREYFFGAVMNLDKEVLDYWIRTDGEIARRALAPRCTAHDVKDMFDDIQWIWDKWIPKGFLSMVAGRAGIGKSGIVLNLAHTWLESEMRAWPDHSEPQVDRKNPKIMWCDTEQTQQLLVQRCKSWNVPMDRLFWPVDPLKPDAQFPTVHLDDPHWIKIITDLICDEKPDWLVVDSFRGAFLGDENSSEVQNTLDAVANLARETNVAITFIHHLRKLGSLEKGGEISIDDVRGSSALVAMMRSVIGLDRPDPDDPRIRARVLKTNLCAEPPPLGVAIEEDGKIAWQALGAVPEVPRKETSVDRASDFLLAKLAHGYCKAVDLFEEAEGSGISKASLRRAKIRLNVTATKSILVGDSAWIWALPASNNGNKPAYSPLENQAESEAF